MKMVRLVFSIFGFFCVINSFAASDVVPLDKIVAVVNNDVITQTEVNKQFNVVKKQMQQANAPMPDEQTLRKKILDQLIARDLQLQVAKRNNITVTQDQFNKILNNIAVQNHLTMAQLKTAVEQQGINYDMYLKQIRDEIIIAQLQQRALGTGIAISNKEVNDFIQQNMGQGDAYHLIDLLLPLSSSPSAEELAAAQKQATQVMTQLQQGANIGTTTGPKWQISDLGWRMTSALPDIFAGQVAKMKLNEFMGPLRAPNGLHLIKLVGVKNGQMMTKQQAQQILYQKKLGEKVQPWIDHLRTTAYVKVMD